MGPSAAWRKGGIEMTGFRHERRATAGLAALLLATAFVSTANASTAVNTAVVRCGETLIRSTVLAADVGPCAGDGIVVGADGITVNLNGHRVLGTPGPGDNVGIRVQRRTRVVVSGGTVRGFGAGVAIMGGSRNIVTGVTAKDNVGLIDGSGDFGDGLAIFNSSYNILRANTVRHNGPFDGVGVFGASSTGNQVVGNVVELNNIARFVPQLDLMLNLDEGINLGAGLSGGNHTTVVNNTVRNNGLNGINACSIRGNPCITTDDVIVGNLVQANGFGDPLNPDPYDTGDGIHVVSIKPPGFSFSDFFPVTRELVANNTVLDNAGNGIAVGSSNNQILNNRVVGNGSSLGDVFFDLQDVSLNNDCDSNSWYGNTFVTADPVCTTAGGHRLPAPAMTAPKASSAAVPPRPAAPAEPPLGRRFPSF